MSTFKEQANPQEAARQDHHLEIAKIPLKYKPAESLFPGEITTTEGLLSRDIRGKVERVFLIVDTNSLSMPVLYSSRITPALFENFPNAEIVSDNQIAGLYKAPDGRSAAVLEGKFTDAYGKFSGKKDHTIGLVVGPMVVESLGWRDAFYRSCCLTVDFDSFGITTGNMLNVLKDGNILPYPKPAEAGFTIDEIEASQDSTLRHLGFDKLPPEGSKVILTPDIYSDRLNNTIKELSALVESKASGLPLVFVNPFKGMKGSCTPHQWVRPITDILEPGDTAVAINEGPASWKTGAGAIRNEGVDELYSLLSNAPHQENLLRLGSNDVTRLAAMLHLTRETGGCLVDIQTGTTHLADWMNTPEVVLRVDSRFIRARKNLITVGTNDFDMIPEAVRKLIHAGGKT